MNEAPHQRHLPPGHILRNDHIEYPDGTYMPLHLSSHLFHKKKDNTSECNHESKKRKKLNLLPHEVGMPNAILRSALFGIVPRGKRKQCDLEKVASWSGTDVLYTGQKLNQGDLDVWAMLVRMAGIAGDEIRQEPCHVRFFKSGLIKSLKRAKGRATYQWLDQTLLRLHTGSVRLFDGKYHYNGQLIRDYYVDEDTGEVVVELNTKLARIFCPQVLTAINFDERLQLSTDLAKWLHGHLSSHSGEYFCRLSKLCALCGSTTGTLKKFRQQLVAALDRLTGEKKLVKRYQINMISGENDYHVKIELTPRKRGG